MSRSACATCRDIYRGIFPFIADPYHIPGYEIDREGQGPDGENTPIHFCPTCGERLEGEPDS